MAKTLVDALVPIFAGLPLGFWAGRRGLIDNVNISDLAALVMSIVATSALFTNFSFVPIHGGHYVVTTFASSNT